jgi:hypothetical protein
MPRDARIPVRTHDQPGAVFRSGRLEGIEEERMGSRLTWPQICRSDEYRGRWVALDACVYDPRTAQPTEGTVVDADEDLVALCSRMQATDSKHCAILYCDERATPDEAAPVSPRPSANPPRAYH